MKALVSVIAAALAALYPTSLSANIAWPALFIAESLYQASFLVIVSVIIEALVFYWFIPNISYVKAGLMSLIGNAVSFSLGTILGAAAPMIYYLLLGFISDPLAKILSKDIYHAFIVLFDITADWLTMLLVSALVEGITLRLIFGYKGKQLWLPVFAGNLITYILLPLYAYFVIGISKFGG